jgi:hypothetical protein
LTLNFQTVAPATWWTIQQYIIDERRPSLYIPLVPDSASNRFKEWQAGSDCFATCWR